MIKVFQVIIREVAFRTSRLMVDIDMTQITMCAIIDNTFQRTKTISTTSKMLREDKAIMFDTPLHITVRTQTLPWTATFLIKNGTLGKTVNIPTISKGK